MVHGPRQGRAEYDDHGAAALSVTMIMWVLWGWSIAYAGTSVGGIFGDPATGFLLKDTMVSDKASSHRPH